MNPRIAMIIAELARRNPWKPLAGPQTLAYESMADIVGYGGAAGGGKTDLACGSAITRHEKTLILRREATQLTGIIDRLTELLKSRNGYNGQEKIWRLVGRQIEFGSTPSLDDWNKYQGRPHDFLVFDEAANFLELQVRALLGWLRSTTPGQHCQALLTFNPPTSAEGRWIISFFAPWLDKKHPNPAEPGELRYAASLPADAANPNGRDLWVEDGRSFVMKGGEPCYDFDPDEHDAVDVIRPQSRTFIPSRVTDNPYLMGTGYLSTLQALPEPLRSQMLYGDFQAGIQDDPWQVIPTRWVEIAMERWRERSPRGEMLSMGVDVARGGKDNTLISTRHKVNPLHRGDPVGAMWFDRLKVYPGSETPNGNLVAGLVIAERRDHAPIHIDVIGVGSSPYDVLNSAGQDVYGVNVSESATALDKSGRLYFFNLRTQLWWQMREALDPQADNGIALPPDKDLLVELCAPKWSMSGFTIKVESRDEIIKRIGRSPDRGTAVVLALIDTPKIRAMREMGSEGNALNWDPFANMTP